MIINAESQGSADSHEVNIHYFQILLGLSFYAWASMPVTTMQMYLFHAFPLPPCFIFDFLVAFVAAVNLYMYIYGVLKSFSHKYRFVRVLLCEFEIQKLESLSKSSGLFHFDIAGLLIAVLHSAQSS